MGKLANISTSQLENRIHLWMKKIGREHPRAFGCNLAFELVSCDAEKAEVVFRIRTTPEMGNPWGVTHGGMLALLQDWAMGVTSRTFLDYNNTPTIDMQIQYLKPVPLDADLYIRTTVTSRGKKIAFLSTKAWSESEEEILTTATGVYYLREPGLQLT